MKITFSTLAAPPRIGSVKFVDTPPGAPRTHHAAPPHHTRIPCAILHLSGVSLLSSFLGFGFGNHDFASFILSKTVSLNTGSNTLDILSMMVGLQNYGPWFDIAAAGIFSVTLAGLENTKRDLSSTEWTYQVGLEGERLGLDNMSLANSSLWIQGSTVPKNKSLIWYKSTVLAPEGTGPISLNLSSMGKGQAWINGHGIGRYWSAYLSPSTGCSEKCDYRGTYDSNKCLKKCGEPAQTLYHIPRTWMHSGENLLVLHEELGGDPLKISLTTRTGQHLCGHVSDADNPSADSWKPNLAFQSQKPEVRLACDQGYTVVSILFASYGTPEGICGAFSHGSCHANILSTVQQLCIGKQKCSIPVSTATLGDPCPGMLKSLAVEVVCSA